MPRKFANHEAVRSAGNQNVQSLTTIGKLADSEFLTSSSQGVDLARLTSLLGDFSCLSEKQSKIALSDMAGISFFGIPGPGSESGVKTK